MIRLSGKDVVLSNNPSQKEMISVINDMFKNHWKRGYSYIKRKPQIMRSKPLPKVVKQLSFAQYITYMQTIVKSSSEYDFSNLHPVVAKELNHWETEGGYCIYMSVLLYGLLTRDNLVNKEDIAYFQGLYDFPLRKDFPPFIPIPKRQMGIHAWLTIQGVVIDVTAKQNANFFNFNFKAIEMVLGEYPNDYKLIGHKETDETIDWYLNYFSSFMGMTVDEWLEFHHIQSS